MSQDSITESTLVGPSFAPRLTVTTGEGVGQKFLLRADTRIGRERDNDIVLTDPRISRHHATIGYEAGNWTITDLNSANGTLVNGIPIMAPQVLQDGDTISLGDTDLVFQLAPGLAPAQRAAEPMAARRPPATRPMGEALPAPAAGLPWVGIILAGLFCVVLLGVAIAAGGFLLTPRLPISAGKTPAALAATPELVLAYQDDFSDPRSGWDDAFDKYTMKQYGNQKYYIVVQTSNLVAWGLANRDISDFVLEADAAQEEGPDNNGYGLLFRWQDRQNFYRFDISGDGFYLLSKFVKGEWVTLVDWSESPYINKGKTANRLKVVAFGPSISIYANDQLLATVNDNTFAHGNFGVFAGTFSEPNLWVSFDNIRVWTPKGSTIAMIPTATPTQAMLAPTPAPSMETPVAATSPPSPEASATPQALPTTMPIAGPTHTPQPLPEYVSRDQPRFHGETPLTGHIVFPVYDPQRGTYDIYIATADGKDRQRIVEQASQPDLSSDGKIIVYRSWQSDARGITLRDTYGGDTRRITSAFEAGRPAFSPNAQIILYHTREGSDRKPAIFRTEGTKVQVLRRANNAPVGGESPAWAPDGERFVYKTCLDSHCAIFLAKLDGSDTRKITDDVSDNAPAVSPDGSTVAFMSFRDKNWEIYSVGIDGGPVKRLTNDPANDGLPAWSPDGKTIAFVSNRDGQWAIWAMNPDGSNQRQLFPLEGSLEGKVQLDVQDSLGWTEERIAWGP
jgi:hypothetical protein